MKRKRRCWWCFKRIDPKQPKDLIVIERKGWDITKQYIYHKVCWIKKQDSEAMRKYKERLA